MVSKTASQSAGGGGGFVKKSLNNSKVKQIVETTRCTPAEAEDALNQVGGELEAACSYILDHAGENEWNVKKGRKITNKKPEPGAAAVEVKPETKKSESGNAAAANGQVKQDRPPRTDTGRGERRGGNGTYRGGNRGPGNRPGWSNKKAEPGATVADAEVKPEAKKDESGDTAAPATTDGEVKQEQRPPRTEHGRGERRGGGTYRGGSHRGSGHKPAWKAGQVFTRTESKPASSPAATTETTQSPPVVPTPVQPEVIKTPAGPLSFAAVCAARAKKPEPPTSPATTTTQASPGVSPDANLISSEPQQAVDTADAEKETNAELEAATPEVHADDEALPEASGELEAADPEIQTEIEAEETADEPKVSTPDHLEQIGQNAWSEKYYMEKAAPPVVEIRRPILEFSETQTVYFEKPVVKAAPVPMYTQPVSTPSTPAVYNSNALPTGFAHSSYYHHPQQTQQVQQQQQQPVLQQSQQQQMYNPLHYGSYVPPQPGPSGNPLHYGSYVPQQPGPSGNSIRYGSYVPPPPGLFRQFNYF